MKTEYLCLLVLVAVLLAAYFVSWTRRDHEEQKLQPSTPEKFTAPDEDMSDMEIINDPEDAAEIALDSNQGTFGFGRMGNSFFA